MPEMPKYCPVPWHSVNIRNNGDYRICCHANVSEGAGILREESGAPLNLATSPVDSVRNHSLLKEVRQSFLEGKWHPTCRRCQVEEENSQRSGRMHAITRLSDAGLEEDFRLRVMSSTQPDGTIAPADFPVHDLDIRFGNKCNLRCRSCGPTDSSSWYSDFFRLGRDRFEDSGATVHLKATPDGRIEAVNNRFGWYEGISVGAQMPADMSNVRRIYFAGGEPLIIRQHQEMLEWLVENKLHGQVGLEYNTNLTVLPAEILELWKKFRVVGVGVSMDGFGRFHEYMRYPGRADVMEKNLRRLDEAEGNIRWWLACTVSAQNASHLPDFILWKEKQGFKKTRKASKPPISAHLLHSPNHMNLRALPTRAKELIERRLTDGYLRVEKEAGLGEAAAAATKKLFDGIVRYMKSADRSAHWRDHWEYNRKLDLIRGQSFFDLDPELAALLEEGARMPAPSVSGP